ncbi:hypothetical protein CLAFUW4_00901 [Fulvia fulva]|uniref:Uncharacterized protein n=1 Tax=Passalora fulva TaxID=5499 RepID=A0A9Q8L8T0_PASFU|nr:uncharacterized protein CLAFUR5_00904 [Fulvia fulva]KAK4634724.1 hypothetical protein CLAFUR4_00902 [Fulvia fulva]KAK4637479.1 hypothetical protein CLAFUR0_00902 [Fulvia fulva]UJO12819.1 hypothetical protein CLAFUR5_00904 [Fulvia fulva]WPV09764.1 hypothetical protein CLAFUW4_00901 [Fulvia fulva]WPV24581.1 hypothetical protein CLAFUW7_00915 [Fulvia fulva]
MINSIVASLALFGASVAAGSVGRAKVVNKCDYDVYLCNVPASGGGYQQIDKTLSAGDSYTQQWTSLSNDNGWSIKLSQDGDNFGGHIMQYEYTFHNDGIIWYDLSCVDGNPWDKDWEITANGSECSPKQQAYRYSTDDAYGMQSCASDAEITVTLCTGLSADNGTSTGSSGSDTGSDSEPSAPSYQARSSSAPAAPAYQAPASTPPTLATYAAPTYGYNWKNDDAQKSAHPPTTFATSTTAVVADHYGNMVTVVETALETAYVTATAYAEKARRHQHHPHGHADHHT